jgi:beta-ureidopropionase / N-carbamoyl-L-amino-acid hydrolase
MIFTEAERNLARDLFARIRIDTAVPGGGVTRESYGLGETVALQNIAEVAREHGLEPRADRAGNLYITPGGGWPTEAVVIGSHLDSVPCGGNYDGLAGVVAGLLIVLKAKKRGISKPLVALGLRGEESAWFGIPYVGSKALMGKLTRDDLARKHRSKPERSLLQAISGCSLTDPHALLAGDRLLSTNMIKEFWELHIEQGPVLHNLGVPIGAVTGIRGSVRAPNARMYGTAGHSGTTPHHLRQDAVMRFAELMVALEEQRASMHESGKDIVFTCGVMGTDPAKHAITSIADLVHFSLDVRSLDAATAHGLIEFAKQYAGDTVYWDELVTTPGLKINVGTLERIASATKKLGIEAITMPSGAGHDAVIFAHSGVETGMVFVRNQNGSHNPHEDMNIDDFMLGVETLWEVVR